MVRMLTRSSSLPMMRSFSTVASKDQSDDVSQIPRTSLEEFYQTVADFTLYDEEAFEYMTFSAKMAMVAFKNEEEMMSFKGDFQAALAFIGKLDEVDTKGTEPLGNVLEHYGGNDTELRVRDQIQNQPDQTRGLNFREELIKLNKHVQNGYVVLNRPSQCNPDSE